MKELNVIVKNKEFNDIVKYQKRTIIKEIRPSTEKRYIVFDNKGRAEYDKNGNTVPVVYDAIRFRVGYDKNSHNVIVEILKTYTRYIVDERGNIIYHVYDNSSYACQEVVYELGKIIKYNK